ncbi:MAG: SsrA-binding protein [Patescibacteria group bacterium]
MKMYVNKTAQQSYQIGEKLEAGIILTGAEAKAIRTRGIELRDSLARVKDGEVFLVNAIIHPYPFARREDQSIDRERKLLLKESQIKRLVEKKRGKLTIVPLACYTSGRWIKIQLGIGKKKTKVQRKQDLIARDDERRIGKGMY